MKKASDLVNDFFSFYGIKDDKGYADFFNAWIRIAGSKLAAHARAQDVRRGALVVEVNHPGWMQMLEFKKKTILKQIQKQFPKLEINRLQIKVVDNFTPPQIRTDKQLEVQREKEKPLTQREKTQVGDVNTSEKGDDRLKNALERLKLDMLNKESNGNS